MKKRKYFYIRATALIGFSEIVKQLGGSPDRFFAEFELPSNPSLYSRQVISCSNFVKMVDAAADRLGSRDLSLLWSRNMRPNYPNCGPLTLIGFFCKDFEEWINLGIKYWNAHCNAFNVRIERDRDHNNLVHLKIIYYPGFARSSQLSEGILANILGIAQLVSGYDHLWPDGVYFSHSEPTDTHLFSTVFNCQLNFGAENDEFIFSQDILHTPINGSLKIFRPFIELFIRRQISSLPIFDQSVRETTQAAVEIIIGSGNCNMSFIANSLGMSGKKLQRLLAQEGTSFINIMTEVRSRRACTILAESNMEISDIASLLEYSSLAAFTNAFTRREGVSPSEFRRAVLDIEANKLRSLGHDD